MRLQMPKEITKFKQDTDQEIFKAEFPKNFNPKNLEGRKICYGVSLKAENHTGNRLIASLELISRYNPAFCSWFIACELAYLKEQIEDPNLDETAARKLARTNGDKLAGEHASLLDSLKSIYNIDNKILRWYEFDNNNDTYKSLIFKESLAQVYFLYLLGILKNNDNFPINQSDLTKLFNLVILQKDIRAFEEILNQFMELLDKDNKKIVKDLNLITLLQKLLSSPNVFKKQAGFILDIFDVTTQPAFIAQTAQNFYKIVNGVATSRTDHLAEEAQDQLKVLDKNLTRSCSAKYALLDVAMILTLAKTQNFDYLLYPLRQQKSYLKFFNIIRILCQPFNLKIIDIILKQRLLVLEQKENIHILPDVKNSVKEPVSSGRTAFFATSSPVKIINKKDNDVDEPIQTSNRSSTSPIQDFIQDNLEELEQEARLIDELTNRLKLKAQKTESYIKTYAREQASEQLVSPDAIGKITFFKNVVSPFAVSGSNYQHTMTYSKA